MILQMSNPQGRRLLLLAQLLQPLKHLLGVKERRERPLRIYKACPCSANSFWTTSTRNLLK
ncbi:hypothetical protein HanPSC8_Chr00c832g0809671 [Helianthus annuus]|nr:hypothetical protein HanPSC8_Chr00c832g0809671 [Helianthus annuus]